jgi:hypothetical protein
MRDIENLPIAISYDSACSYSVNVKTRFAENLPSHHTAISKVRWVIDSLHVNDHVEKCMYIFSTNYQIGMGHFHGVGNEQFFAENNQMGPQTQQMNPGSRHDKLTAHFEDWNEKKLARLGTYSDDLLSPYLTHPLPASSLAKELVLARRLYVQKRDDFREMSMAHRRQIPGWYRMDQTPVVRPNGEIQSVYRNSSSKGRGWITTLLRSMLIYHQIYHSRPSTRR